MSNAWDYRYMKLPLRHITGSIHMLHTLLSLGHNVLSPEVFMSAGETHKENHQSGNAVLSIQLTGSPQLHCYNTSLKPPGTG